MQFLFREWRELDCKVESSRDRIRVLHPKTFKNGLDIPSLVDFDGAGLAVLFDLQTDEAFQLTKVGHLDIDCQLGLELVECLAHAKHGGVVDVNDND